jgi:segregation and condensation protein B
VTEHETDSVPELTEGPTEPVGEAVPDRKLAAEAVPHRGPASEAVPDREPASAAVPASGVSEAQDSQASEAQDSQASGAEDLQALGAEDLQASEPAGEPGDAGEPAPGRPAETTFESFAAAWVPPWARSLPELLIEPAADYPPEELGVGRLAYADPEELPNPDDFEPGMADRDLRGALEAILLVVDEPVAPTLLAQVLEEPTDRLESTLRSLAEEYTTAGRGFELRQVAGGWRFYTRGEYATYVERFVLDGQQIRLTQAALETLAVVAYKQPVTRSRVAAIRGVNCDGVMKTLVTRGLVEECGTEPESGAHLYRTTRLFLEKIGVNSVEDLPSLGPFLPDNVDEIDLAQR